MAGVPDYSTTAGSNTTVGGVSIAEGMAPGSVNNGMRAMMADSKKWQLDWSGIVTAGTLNAYTVTTNQGFTAYATGLRLTIKADRTSTGAATLSVDGLGAKALRKVEGGALVALVAGDIAEDAIYDVVFDSVLDVFVLTAPAMPTISTFARTILDDADASAVRTTIGAQASDAALTSLAGLSLVSGDLIRATGADALTRLAIGANGHLLQVASGLPAWASLYGASSLTFPNGFIRLPGNLHIMWGSFAAAGDSTTFNYSTISGSISLSIGSIAVVSSTLDGATTAQENTAGVVECTTTGFRVYQANNSAITTFFIAVGA